MNIAVDNGQRGAAVRGLGSRRRTEDNLCHGDASLSADTRHQDPTRQDRA